MTQLKCVHEIVTLRKKVNILYHHNMLTHSLYQVGTSNKLNLALQTKTQASNKNLEQDQIKSSLSSS
jgi:hypothetical protein